MLASVFVLPYSIPLTLLYSTLLALSSNCLLLCPLSEFSFITLNKASVSLSSLFSCSLLLISSNSSAVTTSASTCSISGIAILISVCLVSLSFSIYALLFSLVSSYTTILHIFSSNSKICWASSTSFVETGNFPLGYKLYFSCNSSIVSMVHPALLIILIVFSLFLS